MFTFQVHVLRDSGPEERLNAVLLTLSDEPKMQTENYASLIIEWPTME